MLVVSAQTSMCHLYKEVSESAGVLSEDKNQPCVRATLFRGRFSLLVKRHLSAVFNSVLILVDSIV